MSQKPSPKTTSALGTRIRVETQSIWRASRAIAPGSCVRFVSSARAVSMIPPPIQTIARKTWKNFSTVELSTSASTECGFYTARWAPCKRRPSEELLELHRGAHVALDLQLSGHVGARRVQL